MKIILYPFSLLFRLIVFARNLLYNTGILRTKILEPKVISIGNMSAGGTGKTPLAELITEYLLKKNKFAVLVLKGYKRESDDIKVVEIGFNNANHELNTENIGDEALMLLENLSEIDAGRGLIVVGDDKTKTAKFAAAKFRPDVIIVDDGFQHRKLYRDLDIVILNPGTKELLIPAGRLREPLKNFKRADIIVQNNKFNSNPVNENHENKPQVICSYEFKGLYNSNNEKKGPVEGIKAVVFCGVGDPDSLRELLCGINVNILSFMEFPDHHNYSANEINSIINLYKTTGSEYIITTQKDFIRIRNFEAVVSSKSGNTYKELLFDYPLYYAKIKMQIDRNSELLYNEIDKILMIA